MTVQWDHYDFWANGNHFSSWECKDGSYQAIFYENGDIEFQYQPVSSWTCGGGAKPNQLRGLGAQSTIAIENSAGTESMQRFCNTGTSDTSAEFGQCCTNSPCACP